MEQDVTSIIENAVKPIIHALVDKPEAVEFTVEKSKHSTVFVYICANKSEIGMIIGKEGRHASAIRVLIQAIASKHNVRSLVEIEASQAA